MQETVTNVGSFKPLAVAMVALGVAACASVPAPTAQMAVSRTAVEDAQRAGATEHAPVELRDAQSKLSEATAAAARHDNERARRLAEEAEADARLAEAKAQTAKARAAAAELQQGILLLRRELERKAN
jgi:hypothetical protein